MLLLLVFVRGWLGCEGAAEEDEGEDEDEDEVAFSENG